MLCPTVVLTLLFVLQFTLADVVLDKKTMKLTLSAAELSNLVYANDPGSDGFDLFKVFSAEPDQALVAKKDGYCYGVFRGTTLTADDWSQNLQIGTRDICGSDTTSSAEEPVVCCTVRVGFYDAYHTNYYQDFETALRHCAKNCLDPDECVVLTGHSQGGAIAAVAAIKLADLNPYVMTFGQPATLAPGCPYMASERWYRWVNTRDDDRLGITYDPVPFAPGLGTECWGHFMVLGGSSAHGVAYLGLDDHRTLLPGDPTAGAHTMKSDPDSPLEGYVNRIAGLVQYNFNKTAAAMADAAKDVASTTKSAGKEAKGTVKAGTVPPIPTEGFGNGFLCTENQECMSGSCQKETDYSWDRCFGTECTEDSECESGRCDSGECAQKLGSCQPCDEDSDCKSGKCFGAPLFRCTGPEQVMDDNCLCILNDDCRSGRCDGVNPRICEAVLPMDARCNEDSDCKSGYCSWSLRCADPSTKKTQIDIENKVFSWRTPAVIVGLIVLAIIVYFSKEYYLAHRSEYEEVADAEADEKT